MLDKPVGKKARAVHPKNYSNRPDVRRGEVFCLCTSKEALLTAWAMDAIMEKLNNRLDFYAAEL